MLLKKQDSSQLSETSVTRLTAHEGFYCDEAIFVLTFTSGDKLSTYFIQK